MVKLGIICSLTAPTLTLARVEPGAPARTQTRITLQGFGVFKLGFVVVGIVFRRVCNGTE